MYEEYYLCAVEVVTQTDTGRYKSEKRNLYYACTDFNLYEFYSSAKKNLGYRGRNVRLTLLSRITVTKKEFNVNTKPKDDNYYNRVEEQQRATQGLY